MDALDELCKAWSQCRSCTSIDDVTCDPNEKPYEVGFDPATMRIDCQFNDIGQTLKVQESFSIHLGVTEQVTMVLKLWGHTVLK